MTETLRDIPPAKVGEVVQSFVDGGKTNITATRQGDGNWTVEAS